MQPTTQNSSEIQSTQIQESSSSIARISNELTQKERLDTIRDLAYRTIPPKMIAEFLHEDVETFLFVLKQQDTDEHDAYWEGYLKQMIEMKEATIKAAKNGSNPAQLEVIKSLAQLNRELNYG